MIGVLEGNGVNTACFMAQVCNNRAATSLLISITMTNNETCSHLLVNAPGAMSYAAK